MLPPSPPSTPSVRRRSRKSLVAVAATAAAIVFASGPTSAHAAADGLRGTGAGGVVDPDQQPQHEAAHLVERELANMIEIDNFKAKLLRIDFPFEPGHDSDNKLTGKMDTYLASILDEATGTTVVDLGLNCAKSECDATGETVWVLDCSGKATFQEMPNKAVVDAAISTAFTGENERSFLIAMYPNYELAHEVNIAHMMMHRHRGHNNGHNKPKGPGQRWEKKKKDQKKNRKKKQNQKKKTPAWKKKNKSKRKYHGGKNHHHHGQGGKNHNGGKRPRGQTMQQFSSGKKDSGLNVMGYDSALATPSNRPDNGYTGGSVSSNGDITVQAHGN